MTLDVSRFFRPTWRRIALALTLPSLAGCASYTNQTQTLRGAGDAGDFPMAAQIAQNEAQKHSGTNDALLWDLEAGATTTAAGQTDASLAAFNNADQLFDYWDARPPISLSRETAATLVNQTTLPYRGTDYDRIMESTYQALNYLKQGKPDQARVELNRALERQRVAVTANAKRLEDAQQAATNASAASRQPGGSTDNYDVQAAENDPQFKADMQQNYGELDSLRPYAPYVNPFTTYLEGIFLMAQAQTPSDIEKARVDLQRVRDMIGPNPYIDADYALVQQLPNGTPLPDLTYVIYETGQGPIREETKIQIPLFLVTREVPYVGVAFPRLKFNSEFNHGLVVSTTNATPISTTLLCDMDSVVGQEFRNELPVVVVKTLISAGVKAAAQYGLYEATRNNNTLGLLTEIGGVIYQAGTNQADLRTWTTLPKEFVFCRLPTPPDRQLQISAENSGETRVVDLPAGKITIVYVKSTSAASRLEIQTFTLR